jgi:hypothetical protein
MPHDELIERLLATRSIQHTVSARERIAVRTCEATPLMVAIDEALGTSGLVEREQ